MSGDKFADPFKSQSWTALKWCNCCFELFKTEVEARERCNSMAMTPTTTPKRKHPPKPPPPTFNTLMRRTGSRTRLTRQMQIIKQTNVKP
ncbi:hypothetical protein P5673_027448 [Acropora cervicornis]|uniref:Uncharacterized protein n=1 Tax=Acropora cervicornis TaxID=6130 RepID=A0AAD9PZQ6_ACRCE|nr:hypothetical protein P5673_027448 [Acropora cervicornis]